MKNNMGVAIIEVNLEIFEFFGTQTIEGQFQYLPLFGRRKMLIS
jgi:hypothetical protein